MRSKFKWIFTLLVAFTMQFSFAQEKTITGSVSDASGPLPGVNVVVKGTQRGTQTNFDGSYSIKAKEGETLVYSFLGMTDVSKLVGASNVINTVMQEDSKVLETVVVTGYSIVSKESFTGTAKVVKADQIEKKNVSNIAQALAGEVAGVRVINTSGQPGTVGTIRVRGYGSVNGNKDPLYVVDGIPYNGSIAAINPGDIATTTVLKDATATAIYGARGANGVILITTKNAKKGESFIEVDSKSGVNFALLPRYETIKSPEQYIALGWEGLYNQGVATGVADPVGFANTELFGGNGVDPTYNMWNVADGGELIDPVTKTVRPGVTRRYNPENWEDYAFQNSMRTETNLRLGGASEKSRYFTSIGYLSDKGYSINSDYERISARLNLTQDVKSWLTASANIGYSISTQNTAGQSQDSGSVFWFVDNMPSIYPLFQRDVNGNMIQNIYGKPTYDYGVGRGFGGLTNAIADAHYSTNKAKRHDLSTNFSFDFKLGGGFTFETKVGTQFFIRKFDNLENQYFGPSATSGGSIFKTDTQDFSYNFLKLLRYKKKFGNHEVEALVAHENNSYERKFQTASKSKVALNDIPELNQYIVNTGSTSYTQGNTLESIFGQVSYNFDKRYFLSGTVRRDGSSRFIQNKWDTFGSVGASWIVSNESFMANRTFFDNLKLKTSYGLTGDQEGLVQYPAFDAYEIGVGADGNAAFIYDTKGNKELTWETSKMFQAGVELGIKNRVEVSLDYYSKITDNLLSDRRQGPSDGFAIIQVNEGKMRNRGIEFDVTGHILKGEDYFLDLSVNGEVLDNEMLEMPIEASTGKEKHIDVQDRYGRSKGHSIYDYYLREWAGVDAQTGQAMWVQKYADLNGNGVFDGAAELIQNLVDYENKFPDRVGMIRTQNTYTYANATLQYNGKSAIPDVRGGINLATGFHGFDLSVQVLYSFGGYSYDAAYAGLMDNDNVGSNNWHTDILKRWQKPGDVTDVPRISNGLDDDYASGSTRFLTKSDYISLNNVRLGYTVPSKHLQNLKIAAVSFFVSGDNLWLSTKRDGFNPSASETGQTSTYAYSPLSTITGGVRVKF